MSNDRRERWSSAHRFTRSNSLTEHFLHRIHKRLIDLNAPTEVVKQIIINIEAGVEVEVTIAA
jgi:ribosomal protein S10